MKNEAMRKVSKMLDVLLISDHYNNELRPGSQEDEVTQAMLPR